jgi:hypothetical protein
LRGNNILISLDLRWNDISNQDTKAILAALEENSMIASLELRGGNQVSEDILNKLRSVTEANRDKTFRRASHLLAI